MRFLIKFWPVWIPLGIYLLWRMAVLNEAKKRGVKPPPVTRGPIFTAIFATFAMIILCFLALGFSEEASDALPVVPHLENGKIVGG